MASYFLILGMLDNGGEKSRRFRHDALGIRRTPVHNPRQHVLVFPQCQRRLLASVREKAERLQQLEDDGLGRNRGERSGQAQAGREESLLEQLLSRARVDGEVAHCAEDSVLQLQIVTRVLMPSEQINEHLRSATRLSDELVCVLLGASEVSHAEASSHLELHVVTLEPL